MHNSGIAHLDLKEENVVVKLGGKNPKFALIDFGFAVHALKEQPFEGIDYLDMKEYYEDHYGTCFTRRDSYRLRDIKQGKKVDPRYLDDLFLCALSVEVRE